MSQSTLFLDVAEVLEIRLVAGGIVLFIIYIFLRLLTDVALFAFAIIL